MSSATYFFPPLLISFGVMYIVQRLWWLLKAKTFTKVAGKNKWHYSCYITTHILAKTLLLFFLLSSISFFPKFFFPPRSRAWSTAISSLFGTCWYEHICKTSRRKQAIRSMKTTDAKSSPKWSAKTPIRYYWWINDIWVAHVYNSWKDK